MGACVADEFLFWKRFIPERRRQLPKRIRTMAHLVLVERVHLTERNLLAHRNEHRIVAEAAVSSWRPDERSVDAAVKGLRLSIVRPGNRQRACEMRSRSRVWLGRFDLAPDLFHGMHPVPVAVFILGPASGKDPGTPMKRINAKAAVIGERGQTTEISRFARLQIRIVSEAVADFLRLGKVEFGRAYAGNAEGLDQLGDLAELAGIMSRDDQPVADRPHRPVAFN